MRIVVTGGSGKAGRWVVRDLRERGHRVLNVDARPDGIGPHGSCIVADLTDPGQAFELMAGAEAVVHLAAIPAPELRSPAETFRINALSTYNVFAAAEAHRVARVVWASSETVLGLPFDTPPAFAPIDETIDLRPESSYALS
jgi:nucleoside-diphosphate-sugar epimerase